MKSPETLKRMRIAQSNRSPKWRARISAAKKKAGIIPPSRKGSTHTPESIAKMRLAHKGNIKTPETRLKLSQAMLGPKAPNWQGGKTEKSIIIRHSLEYRLWREAIFKRDNYMCQDCGDDTGGNLQAHHIKPFALYPELRFEISNGVTLCEPCHKSTDTWGSKTRVKSVNTVIHS